SSDESRMTEDLHDHLPEEEDQNHKQNDDDDQLSEYSLSDHLSDDNEDSWFPEEEDQNQWNENLPED
ncbi:hypothetical protein A2U01_0026112, partial [Trifolium medium]|nr:hypothetical protein [Trifolium medium]